MRIQFSQLLNLIYITSYDENSLDEIYTRLIDDLCVFNTNTTYIDIHKESFRENQTKWIDLETKKLNYSVFSIKCCVEDISCLDKFMKLPKFEDFSGLEKFPELFNLYVITDKMIDINIKNEHQRLKELIIHGNYNITNFQNLQYLKNLVKLTLEIGYISNEIKNFNFLVYLTKLECLEITNHKCKLYLENMKSLRILNITGDIDTIELPYTNIFCINIKNNLILNNLNFINDRKIEQLYIILTSIKNFDILKYNKTIKKLLVCDNIYPFDIINLPINVNNLTLRNNNAKFYKHSEKPKLEELRNVKYLSDEIINLEKIVLFKQLKYVYFNIITDDLDQNKSSFITSSFTDKYAICENVKRKIPHLSFLKNSIILVIAINLVYVDDFSVILAKKIPYITRNINYSKFIVIFKYFKFHYLNLELVNNITDNKNEIIKSNEFRRICLECETDYDTGKCEDEQLFIETMKKLTKIRKICGKGFKIIL